MIKRTLNELKSYEAPGHFNMTAMRIHGKEETGAQKFWIEYPLSCPAAVQSGRMKITLLKRSTMYWRVK